MSKGREPEAVMATEAEKQTHWLLTFTTSGGQQRKWVRPVARIHDFRRTKTWRVWREVDDRGNDLEDAIVTTKGDEITLRASTLKGGRLQTK